MEKGVATQTQKSGRNHGHANLRRRWKGSDTTPTSSTAYSRNYSHSSRARISIIVRKRRWGKVNDLKSPSGVLPGHIPHGIVARSHAHHRNSHCKIKYSCQTTSSRDNAPPVYDVWKQKYTGPRRTSSFGKFICWNGCPTFLNCRKD